jgi:N-acetylmuramoyl-L-alanine amidase
MFEIDQDPAHDRARVVFDGLVPSPCESTQSVEPASRTIARARAAARTAMPLVLTGALTLGLGMTGAPHEALAAERKAPGPKPQHAHGPSPLRTALAQFGAAITPGAVSAAVLRSRSAPVLYTVEPGDTVSDIAARFGLSTAGILALNGLSWKSMIFPGQVLHLVNTPTKGSASSSPVSPGGTYRVRSGDAISAIAARFGVSTQSILDANGLTWKSIVYPGQTLLIPGTPSAPALEPDASFAVASPAVSSMPVATRPVLPGGPAAPAAAAAAVVSPEAAAPESIQPLSVDGRAHAQTIIRVGRSLGVPDYGIVIALATAMQESSMRNISWGDRDSVGLFQQRPSAGWGTAEELLDPAHAAALFFAGRAGHTRGLLDIPGWQSMTLTAAAQAVQISAFPDAYAKWEPSAWKWFSELT